MHYHWGQRTGKKRNVTNWRNAHKMKKGSATLTVVSWNNNRAVYIVANCLYSETKRFAWRWNKVGTTRTSVLSTEWNRTWPSTRLVSKWKNGGWPCLLRWSILLFRMRGCCISLTKIKTINFYLNQLLENLKCSVRCPLWWHKTLPGAIWKTKQV